jgi:hypothetical protein
MDENLEMDRDHNFQAAREMLRQILVVAQEGDLAADQVEMILRMVEDHLGQASEKGLGRIANSINFEEWNRQLEAERDPAEW